MKRIVISGSQGFLGRYLSDYLLRNSPDHQILGIGRSPPNAYYLTHRITWSGQLRPAPLPPGLSHGDQARYCYEQADICDRDRLLSLFEDFQPDWVFHLASGLRDDEPCSLCRTNVEGATALTQALIDAECRPQMIVYGSTGGVYGMPQRLPLDEETPMRANDIYSCTKLAAEHVTGLLTRDHHIPAVWGRLFNLVGPGQDERHVCGYIASRVAAMGTEQGCMELTVGQLEPTRDFIDVRDAARALVLLAEHGRAGLAYNIASGSEVAIGEVLATLLRLTNLEGQVFIKHGSIRRADIPRHFADISRLLELGFARRFTLAQSLHDLLAYYIEVVRPMEITTC